MGSLDGQAAIVFGSATGMGSASAKLLAKNGASVAVVDINDEGAAATAAAISEAGGTALAVHADTTEESQIEMAVQVAVEHLGKIDILHNNAAPMHLVPADKGPTDTDIEVWDTMFAVIVRGAYLACKHVIPIMQENGGGAIVNTTSMAGQRGVWGCHGYGSAKAALDNLTRHIAARYGPDGIRCNGVAPGLITHPEPGSEPDLDPRFRQEWLDIQCTKRIGVDHDVARTVLFLVEPEADFINGEVIAVDGGVLARGSWGLIGDSGAPQEWHDKWEKA